MNSISLHIVLAAGGTGGHMVPADVLGQVLRARGHHVALVTDERGLKLPGLFDGVPRHVIPSSTLSGGPLGWLRAWKTIRSEEHTSELQSLMRISYAVFCLKIKNT